MSFQWTFIAGYLYFEITVVMIMILPTFSPRHWNAIFKSRMFAMFQSHTAIYFYGFMGVLCLFLLDAIREMRKYSHGNEPAHVHLTSEMKGNVKLFRAQRNFYITGFSIFLTFVIRRLIGMILKQHELTVESETLIEKARKSGEVVKTQLMRKLSQTENMLDEEKSKNKQLSEEINTWKLKCDARIPE